MSLAALAPVEPLTGDDSTVVFRRADIVAAATTIVEFPDGMLAVRENNTVNIEFALYSWYAGLSEVSLDDTQYTVVFRGSGTGGGLREMRHSYWGEANNAGYMFYAPRRLIRDAMTALDRWFD